MPTKADVIALIDTETADIQAAADAAAAAAAAAQSTADTAATAATDADVAADLAQTTADLAVAKADALVPRVVTLEERLGDMLTFEFAGTGASYSRSALIMIPEDWDNEPKLRSVAAGTGGHSIILAFGGNTARTFAREIMLKKAPPEDPALDPHAHWADAIVIYLQPPTFGEDNHKFNAGHIGNSGYTMQADDVGYVVEVLHRVRTMLQAALDDRHGPGVYEPFDPDKLYAIGWSVGAAMLYRMIAEAPLEHVASGDPYVYRFDAVLFVSGTIGGFRRKLDFVGSINQVLNSPWPAENTSPRTYQATAVVPPPRILHVHGELDSSVASRDATLLKAPPGGGPSASGPFPDPTGLTPLQLVMGMNSYLQFRTYFYYAALDAENLSRFDYTVESGLARWHDLHANAVAGGWAAGDTSIPTLETLPILAGGAYGMPDFWRWDPSLVPVSAAHPFGSPVASNAVVFLLLAGTEHVFPKWRIRDLFFDFCDGTFV